MKNWMLLFYCLLSFITIILILQGKMANFDPLVELGIFAMSSSMFILSSAGIIINEKPKN
jgi:hypothetical protein